MIPDNHDKIPFELIINMPAEGVDEGSDEGSDLFFIWEGQNSLTHYTSNKNPMNIAGVFFVMFTKPRKDLQHVNFPN